MHQVKEKSIFVVLIADEEDRYLTWEQVRQYLDAQGLDKKREELGL